MNIEFKIADSVMVEDATCVRLFLDGKFKALTNVWPEDDKFFFYLAFGGEKDQGYVSTREEGIEKAKELLTNKYCK